jgi:aerobic-type carbon monoxide dehydrogenase small subunit (CoxS/CutS family)
MPLTSYELEVNGQRYSVETEPRKLLSDVLREDCGLTGTHVGCEHGVCGACTVLLDGEPVRSCLMFGVQGAGQVLTTIEGAADDMNVAAVARAFHANHGLQCGFCTPGLLLTLGAYLSRNPGAEEDALREVLASSICRCTGYQNIVRAALEAARTLDADRGQDAP